MTVLRVAINRDREHPFWEAWARRTPRQINIVANGTGLNLHRKGGVSFTGIPRSGGTTLCWGAMRRDVTEREAGRLMVEVRRNTEVRTYGPFMLRVGENF